MNNDLPETLGTNIYRTNTLLRICGCSTLTALLAVGGLVYRELRPTPMAYTAAQGPGIAVPGIMDDAYVLDFATRFVEVRYTFQPSTLAARQADIQPWLHPRLLKTFEVEAERERKMVKQAELSAETVVMKKRVVQRKGSSVQVHLEASRGVSLGERRNPPKVLTVDMVLMPFPEGGQVGKVVVYSIATTPPLSTTGE